MGIVTNKTIIKEFEVVERNVPCILRKVFYGEGFFKTIVYEGFFSLDGKKKIFSHITYKDCWPVKKVFYNEKGHKSEF